MHIQEIRLHTRDLAAQQHFYAEQLGLPLISRSSAALTFQVGASRLTFDQAELAPEPIYHFAFNIPPQQFAEAKAWLAVRAGQAGVAETFFEHWNAHALYFFDPAGNIVELIARHTLSAASRRPFSAASLLGISEIGIVTDNVADTVAQLRSAFDAPVYRNSQSAEFTALGDDEGLFIVVRRGRLWFAGTLQQRPSTFAPIEVTIAVPGGSKVFSGPPYHIQ